MNDGSSIAKGFWQRSGTVLAVVATFELAMHIVRPWLVARVGDAGSVLAEMAVTLWLAAFGFTRVSPSDHHTPSPPP